MFDWQCVIAACLSGILNTEDNGRSSTASPTRRRPPFMPSSMWAPLCLAAQSKQFFFKAQLRTPWFCQGMLGGILLDLIFRRFPDHGPPAISQAQHFCIFANILIFFVRSQHFFSKTSTQILYAKIVKLDGKTSLNTLSAKWYSIFFFWVELKHRADVGLCVHSTLCADSFWSRSLDLNGLRWWPQLRMDSSNFFPDFQSLRGGEIWSLSLKDGS